MAVASLDTKQVMSDNICIICGKYASPNTYFCGIECRQESIRRDFELLKQPMSKKCPIPPAKTYERTLGVDLQDDNTIID